MIAALLSCSAALSQRLRRAWHALAQCGHVFTILSDDPGAAWADEESRDLAAAVDHLSRADR